MTALVATDTSDEPRDVHALWCAIWTTHRDPCNCQEGRAACASQRSTERQQIGS